MPDREALKAVAAARAAGLVQPGMLVGLGTGTTARAFAEELGKRVSQGLEVRVVPTSRASARLAAELGIPQVDDPVGPIDLAVDGADEIDPERRLIKGRGGALTREKLVAAAARRVVIIADDSKLVSRLGRGVLPIEVLPFLWRRTQERVVALGPRCELRTGPDGPVLTDNGNYLLDLTFVDGIADPEVLAGRLKQTLGVVEHGIFVGLADACIVAGADGIQVLGSLD